MSAPRIRLALAAFMALALALPLSGCFAAGNTAGHPEKLTDGERAEVGKAMDNLDTALDDTTDALDSLMDIPALLADIFGEHGSIVKDERVEVADAATGEVLAAYNAEEANAAADTLGNLAYADWRLAGTQPKEDTAEYILSIYQREAIKLGQDADDLGTFEALRIATFKNSSIVQLALVPLGFDLAFELPATDLAALRGLAG